jgi:2-methylisocitrate lyase-like PEP mutase family enzyme
LTASIEAITRAISVPLSVDSEGGYANDPQRVGENIYAFVNAGAVGINIEDGSGSPELFVAKVDAARNAAQRTGTDLFINARIDVFLRKLVPAEQAVDETVARAKRYIAAGCDGVFVPLISDPREIQAVAKAIDPVPLNVMAVRGLPDAAELRRLGARRLSAGTAVAKAAISLTRKLATDFLADGRSDAVYSHITDTTDMNSLFAKA